MTKSGMEIMEIFDAYDLTGCAWSAADLAGCDAKDGGPVYRDPGRGWFQRAARPKAIDPFLAKIEEKVDRSKGRIRADVVHRDIVAMGFTGSERSTRRAVAECKKVWRQGRRRIYRPWIPSLNYGPDPLRPAEGSIRLQRSWASWPNWSRVSQLYMSWSSSGSSWVLSSRSLPSSSSA